MSEAFNTVISLARFRAETQGDKLAYANLRDGKEEQRRISFTELDTSCQRIGAALQRRNAANERVLLLFPQGAEFVLGFFGTLYGGATAVPAHTPKPSKRSWTTFEAIVADCKPRFILTCRSLYDNIVAWSAPYPSIAALELLCIEDLEAENPAEQWQAPQVGPESIAFLQYTSGSTSAPKGVMVSHANLLHNAALTARHMGHDENTVIVSWLPLFHDLGLIGIVVQTLFVGGTCYMMSPAAFSGSPALWLQAISRYRATTSMSSDFGYRLCVKSIRPDQLDGIDLSSWRNALNAAEPIHASTLRSFEERFAHYGFSETAFFPAYGLAEATLLSTTSRVGEKPVICMVDRQALAGGHFVPVQETHGEDAVELVSSGRPADDMEIAIINPETGSRRPQGSIGEVWVRGTSIARGYWNAPEASTSTFGQSPAGEDEPHFLRTGDLGFVWDGELFVAGRTKDLIIVRGRNIYPQDIELTVKESDPAFRTVNGAAFSIETDEGESIVIVHEIERTARNRTDLGELIAKVRNAVWQNHDINVADIVLIPPASLPKTTSGKVQRRLTKTLYFSGELTTLPARAPGADWVATSATVEPKTTIEGAQERIIAMIEELTGQPAGRVEADDTFGVVGIDSVLAAQLALSLSEAFGLSLAPTIFWEFQTPRMLAGHIAAAGAPPARPAPATVTGTPSDTGHRDIAIIGVSCRLPGAATKEQFWANQLAGYNAIGEIPPGRWDWKASFGDPLRDAGRTDVRWGGFIDGEDQFSPEFFGISLYEAELMDPQHRLFIKAAWEAIWDGGHDPKALAGSAVGVFAGVQFQDYAKLLGDRCVLSAQALTGNAHAMLANRLSFLLDVNGPSEAIDTACSSSLVAIHNAVRAIRNGECDMALAGGVNLMLTPDAFIMGRQLGVLSPSGQCRTFDAGADGYVRAEGVGVLMLKPLDAAIENRDHVYGVIKGSAVNHGGRATSLTAPNSRAQADLMVRAMRDGGVGPQDISYIEMHGTGTVLGDPIEVEGVKRALRLACEASGSAPSPCALGSVKTNIGHLEPAAGVAGVINVLMALASRTLPGLSNFERPNPHLVLDEQLAIQTRTGPWAAPGDEPLGAMVNSFGFGGANASVVIQQYRPPAPFEHAHQPVFVPLSASSEPLLRGFAHDLAQALKTGLYDARLVDIGLTMQSRGDSGAVRTVVVAATLAELAGALDGLAAEAPLSEPADILPDHVRQWLDGGHADWPDLPEAVRVPLPVPAWPDRSCWFEPRQALRQPAAVMSYLEPAYVPAPAGPERLRDHACIWLIGHSQEQLDRFGAHLQERLPPKNRVVSSLIEAGASGPTPSLEVWNLAGNEPDMVIVLPDDTSAQPTDTRVLFELTKDLMERSFDRAVDVFFVASRPAGSTAEFEALAALAKSAFLENENLGIHTLSFDTLEGAEWGRLVCEEAVSSQPAGPAVLRFAPDRTEWQLRARPPAGPAPKATWFRDGGVYLVPGGAGELGQRLLSRLVGEVDATFVLLGRSGLEGSVAKVVAELAGTANRGDRIQYVSCDITDPNQIQATVVDLVRLHGQIDGVLNLVTAHHDAFLFNKSWQQFAAISDVKVRGSINLDLATAAQPLDFFVAFSSLAALGLAGASDYAYGCAYQNAFSTWRAGEVRAGRRSGASHSISWSRWQWDKYVSERFDQWFASMGFEFIDLETGLGALREIMTQAPGPSYAIYGRPDYVFEHLDRQAGLLRSKHYAIQPNGLAPHSGPQTVAPPLRPAAVHEMGLNNHDVAPAGQPDLESKLAAIVGELLKLDQVERDAPFVAIGLDSVMAIRMIMIVEQRLAIRLTPKDILSHASVTKLAAHLESEQQSDITSAPTKPQGELDTIISHLAGTVKAMLRADAVHPDTPFTSLGVDSIMAVRLSSQLNAKFDVGISPRWFIDLPTVAQMAREIDKKLGQRA